MPVLCFDDDVNQMRNLRLFNIYGAIDLHRISVSDDDKIIIRRDAYMNIVRDASLGQRVRCDEVKPQCQALNHKQLPRILFVLAICQKMLQTKVKLNC